MQANCMIGVSVIVLIIFMALFGVVIHYYFARTMQTRRFWRKQELRQWSTTGTQETRSAFSTQESSEQWSQESRSPSSTQSQSTRASSQRSDRRHRTHQGRSDGFRRLSDIAEEWPRGEYQGALTEATSQRTAESLSQLGQETPASHGCNQTCHGHSPRPGEHQVGLGIAHGNECFA
ncbi:hypothetical protein SBOR_0279 [Sclerotinia borealis F-4128]|uniref:Uncharacterized protein n=1 Tax=Sclerotinia borealis (strain F-4128) TaxID=1432307 RepID=W9CXH4_SCLBF|nr:hypothetical protein SBOR_0279 [Sclerotinia borealis F-4128]